MKERFLKLLSIEDSLMAPSYQVIKLVTIISFKR